MLRSLAAAVVVLVALAGCSFPDAGPEGPAPPLATTVPLVVASLMQADLAAAEPPACAPALLPEVLPTWHEIPRTEGSVIPRGTERIEMVAVLGGIWTGFQVGYRIGDSTFRWSPTIDQGSVVVDILRPDHHEEGGLPWTFAWRSQLLEGQDCTSGAHSGSLAVVVAAHVRT